MTNAPTHTPALDDEVLALVTAAVGRARAAQQSIEGWDQQQADDAVTAIASKIACPTRPVFLASELDAT